MAAKAGVSIATVSRTINGNNKVETLTARRVREAAKSLGYQPNTQARALVSGRSHMLGVMISDITNPFFPELIQSFEEIAVANGYEIMIGSTSHDPRLIEGVIDRMLQRNVEGVAVMTFGVEASVLDRLASRDVPLVFIDVAPNAPGMAALSVDYRFGIEQAIQHLAVLGHRRIAFIAGPRTLQSAVLRENAFIEGTRQIGLKTPPEYIVRGTHTLEGGTKAMEELLRLPMPPTAVMCSNDMTAIGVLHAAADNGLRVPEDVSVIGFDDVHIARYTIPPLTTIQMSCKTLAVSAFSALRAHAKGNVQSAPERYEIPTQLIVRRSTAIPNGALADLNTPLQRQALPSRRVKGSKS
ncbi:MAG TPA: LacI family DNA-binding transcriptional regulator [Acidobacteriaceae bacterium]